MICVAICIAAALLIANTIVSPHATWLTVSHPQRLSKWYNTTNRVANRLVSRSGLVFSPNRSIIESSAESVGANNVTWLSEWLHSGAMTVPFKTSLRVCCPADTVILEIKFKNASCFPEFAMMSYTDLVNSAPTFISEANSARNCNAQLKRPRVIPPARCEACGVSRLELTFQEYTGGYDWHVTGRSSLLSTH